MTKLILMTQDKQLKPNSVLYLPVRLNENKVDNDINFLFMDMIKTLDKVSFFNQDYINEGYLITPNKVSKFNIMESQINFTNTNFENFQDLIENSYFMSTGKNLRKIINDTTLNFEEIFSYTKKYNISLTKLGKILSDTTSESNEIENIKSVNKKTEKLLIQEGFQLTEYDHLILNYLRNHEKIIDFIDISRKNGINSYYFGHHLHKALTYLMKSLTFHGTYSLQTLQSLNVLNDLLYHNSPIWDRCIKKIIERFIGDSELEILKSDFQFLLSLSINLDIDTTEILKSLMSGEMSNDELYYYHIYLIYFDFKIDKILTPKPFMSLYEENIRRRYKSENELSQEFKQLVELQNTIFFFREILLKTRNNPDHLVTDIIFSKHIIELSELIEKNKSDRIEKWITQYPISILNSLLKFHNILFSDNSANIILSKIIKFFDNYKTELIEIKTWINRVLLFCIDNFEEIDNELILQFLNYVNEDNYITINTIIKSLLLNLINSQPLSNKEEFFLNEFLDIDSQQYSKEAIADLTISLVQLKRQPQMQIKHSDGTHIQLLSIDEIGYNSVIIDSFTNLSKIVLIPEQLIDIFVDNRALLSFIRVFFSFQVLQHEWQDYEFIDQPYNKLQLLKTYMRSLKDYQEQISSIKINHSHVVDDITLDFLEIEMILSEEPSIALSKLISMRSKLETRQKNENDWEQFHSLLEQCYVALRLEQEIINYDDD